MGCTKVEICTKKKEKKNNCTFQLVSTQKYTHASMCTSISIVCTHCVHKTNPMVVSLVFYKGYKI